MEFCSLPWNLITAGSQELALIWYLPFRGEEIIAVTEQAVVFLLPSENK
jgi:hypothetical protein